MADKEETKKQELISGTFTVSELINLVKTMNDSNRAEMKEFAKELAHGLHHPEPTDKERELIQQQLLMRIERAKEEDAQKDHKRRHCVHPARPAFPHRRYGTEWGMFNGTSVIAWHYTTYSKRTAGAGWSTDGMQVALGVCQWCGTEFQPGHPGYEDALSWGLSTAIGSYPMNIRTGIWC